MDESKELNVSEHGRIEKLVNRVTPNTRDADQILSCIRENGICILPRYFDEEFCKKLKERCVERAEVKKDVDFEDGSYRRFDCYKGTGAEPNKRVYHVDCFSEQGVQFKDDPFLKGLASDYYGTPHSVHVCMYERHQHSEVPLRGFHLDTFETSTFKAFLYLSDTAMKDGPTSYILGTHADEELRHNKEKVWPAVVSQGDISGAALQTNFSDEQLSEVIQNHLPVIASAGALVLFDTWGVHKGLPTSIGGDRHIVVNYYRKGADLPRSDFGFSVVDDSKKYHSKRGNT
jgi:hypothetical protein